MDEAQIKALLDEASVFYNDGKYDEAIALWREVLESEPSNQKAREGIRMASLLMTGVDKADGQSVDESTVQARIDAGMARVKELAAKGQYEEAVEGCDLLAEIAPHHPQVRQLGHEIRQAAQRHAANSKANTAKPVASNDVLGQQLEKARKALANGQELEAAEAAHKVLRIDPSNMEAAGILSLVDGDTSKTTPLEIGTALAEPFADYDIDADEKVEA